MFKKLLPIVMLVFVAACSNTQGGSMSGMDMKMPCCEKCECCKDGKCGECCKSGECKCCKDGMCKMCMGKMEGMSSMKEGMQCPMMKNGASKDGMKCGCCQGMMEDGMMKKQSTPAPKKPSGVSAEEHNQHHPAQ